MHQKLSTAAIIKRLQAYHDNQAGAVLFVDELKRLLIQDFDSTFAAVRIHKLITQWRDIRTIQFISAELRAWFLSAPLSGKRKAQFRRHLSVCEFVQTMFDEIDGTAQKLRIWSARPDLFVRSILGFVEYRVVLTAEEAGNRAKRFPELRLNPDKGLQNQRLLHDTIRDVADGASLILGQFSYRVVTPSEDHIDDEEVMTAFKLAKRTIFLQQYFDNYSYLNWQANISGNTISFRAPHPDIIYLDHYTQQLLGAGDLLDSIPEVALRAGIRDDPKEEVGSDFGSKPFAESLLSADGEKLLQLGRRAAAQLVSKVRKRILEVFDEAVAVQTVSGSYEIGELVRAWGFLYSLAYCAERWSKARLHTSSKENIYRYTPSVPREALVSRLSQQLGCGDEQSGRLLDQFTAPNPWDGGWDLCYRPLVPLSGNEFGIAATMIGISRFDRNVFSIAVRDSNLDISARGFKPLSTLSQKFSRAGFKTATNKKVRIGGREVTDVDLFFLKDQILFIAQAKVIIEPDSAYDIWKARTKLARAADQLKRTMGSLANIRDDLFDELRVADHERASIRQYFPFILCNAVQVLGERVVGFPVVHFGFLEMLLRGGRVGLLKVEDRIVSHEGERSLVGGSLPSGSDFARLIEDPRPYFEVMFRRPEFVRHSFGSGSFVIEVPASEVNLDGERAG